MTTIHKIAESKSANSTEIALPHDMEQGGGNTPIVLHPHRITSEGFEICNSWGGYKSNDSLDNGSRCSSRGIDTYRKIITYDVIVPVYIRKYQVDMKKLALTLRKYRKGSGLTIKQISERLDIPLTECEHWFRTDKYQSVPSHEIWYDLKKLLNLDTDEFDEQITTIIEDDGKYDMQNRIYDGRGICPTIVAGKTETIIAPRKRWYTE